MLAMGSAFSAKVLGIRSNPRTGVNGQIAEERANVKTT